MLSWNTQLEGKEIALRVFKPRCFQGNIGQEYRWKSVWKVYSKNKPEL